MWPGCRRVLAFWWYRDRLRWVPGIWALLVLSATMSLVLWRVAAKLGYVSDRHTLLLVLCGMYWAVAGLFFIGYRLTETTRRLLTGSSPVNKKPMGAGIKPASILGVALLIMMIAPGLRKTLEPLHSNHDGFRATGEWLHDHIRAADIIEDPHRLASFYAGRELLDEPAPVPPEYKPTRYVVYSTGNDRLRLTPGRESRPPCRGHRPLPLAKSTRQGPLRYSRLCHLTTTLGLRVVSATQ